MLLFDFSNDDGKGDHVFYAEDYEYSEGETTTSSLTSDDEDYETFRKRRCLTGSYRKNIEAERALKTENIEAKSVQNQQILISDQSNDQKCSKEPIVHPSSTMSTREENISPSLLDSIDPDLINPEQVSI